MDQTGTFPRLTFESLRIGDTRSCDVVVDAEQVRAFAALSGDVNPIHVDAAFARRAGFPKPVAHGMLALSAISRLIGTELPGPGALWMSQSVQFTRPVFVGDALTASVTVAHLSAATGVASLRTEVRNTRTGEPVLSGIAQVRLVQDAPGPTAVAAPPPAAIGDAARQHVEPATRRVAPDDTVAERVALVTGSSRGVGRAIAAALAANGAAVIVHYVERGAEANDLVQTIAAAGGRAVACRADLSETDGANRLADLALEAFGRIDILVNSATPPIVAKPVLETTWPDFERYLDMYVRGTMTLVQRAAPEMQARRFGRIINVLSSYAFGAPPSKFAPYVTAKSALAGLSRALAVELGPFGITVNMIAPSTVITEQTGAMSDRARQLTAAQVPLRRLASVDDVAATAAFLAGDGAAFVTGAVVPVTGGGVMW